MKVGVVGASGYVGGETLTSSSKSSRCRDLNGNIKTTCRRISTQSSTKLERDLPILLFQN